MPKRLLALFFTIPLAALSAAGVVVHVCQSSGSVVTGGCDCETQAHHAQAQHESHGDHAHHAKREAPVTLQAQPCCSVERSDASPPIATKEASSLNVDEAPIAIVRATHTEVPRSRLAWGLASCRERAPPWNHGPPIFIRNCALLN